MSTVKDGSSSEKLSRRDFVKAGVATGATAAIAGGALVAPGHAHAHSHAHPEEFTEPPPDMALRIKALRSLMVEKGIANEQLMDQVTELYETQVGPHLGKMIVARAWVDPEFKAAITSTLNAAPVIDEMLRAEGELGWSPNGLGPEGEYLRVVENTPEVHNLITCTLCSCYPWAVLGLPPVWYKSQPYRARAAAQPRSVLQEFGTEVGEEVEVRVWDSNSNVRYMVLPERPAGTEDWTEEELIELITRNSMVGVEKAKAPQDL